MANAVDLGIDNVLEVVQNVFGIDGEVCQGSNGLEYEFCCIAHNDTNPSAHVNLGTGLANCFSCNFSGDLLTLGKLATGKSRAELRRLLKPSDPGGRALAISRRSVAAKRLLAGSGAKAERFIPHVPQDYPEGGVFKYLKQRGFTGETIKRWGIRYVESETLKQANGSEFTIDHCYAIPIRDPHDGSTSGWCYRAGPNSRKWFRDIRYIYTPGMSNVLNKTWFGLWENRDAPEIAVTEGALDAVWLWQNGIPAVAMLGNQAKQVTKIRKLMRFKRVTLFLDRDPTGVAITSYLGEELMKRGVSVFVVRYTSFMVKPNGEPAKDAQDLCPLDLDLALARAVGYSRWRATDRRA